VVWVDWVVMAVAPQAAPVAAPGAVEAAAAPPAVD
jgi:hypothetical protein